MSTEPSIPHTTALTVHEVNIHQKKLIASAVCTALLLHGIGAAALFQLGEDSPSSPVPELEFEIVELRPMAAQQDNSPAPEPDQIKQMAAAQIQRAAVPALIRSEKNTLSDESLAAPSQEESPAQDAIPPAAAITQHTPINPHPGIPPEQVTAAQPIPVAGISTPPRSNAGHLNNPEPTYPLSARKRRLEGIVLLMVDVSNDGHPAAVSVKESSGHIVLDDAARTAVERWRFIPATQDGRNISAQVTIPIRFKLN